MTTRPFLSLIALFVFTHSIGATESIRMTTEARLWLKVPPDRAPLQDVQVSIGTAMAAPWEKDGAVRERHTDISFPVRWWSWRELVVRFTPLEDVEVELTLTGPWALDENGSKVRQEVLWDDLKAEGAELVNGGFEDVSGGVPVGWKAPWAEYLGADDWPLAQSTGRTGGGFAASWCNRPLVQTLHAKAGEPVILHLFAKAATPHDFKEPRALGHDTEAHRALAGLKRGVNLGNGWEAPPGTWGKRFGVDDIDRIAAEGFDHIRVPVAWHFYFKEDTDGLRMDPGFLADLEPVLRRALDKKLHVILNWHHFNDFTTKPVANRARFIAGWETIARHFQSWPPELMFELLNEPCHALTTEALGPIYEATIGTVRQTNPERMIFVSPGRWGIADELGKLVLPQADERIIITIHSYSPFFFTHQGASWTELRDLTGIRYPGPPAEPIQVPESLRENSNVVSFIERYNACPIGLNPCSIHAIREVLQGAREWSLRFGRPIHLGEFGAYSAVDPESCNRYLRDVRMLAEERGIPWTLWEWKAGFGYWNPEKNQARFRESLFGR